MDLEEIVNQFQVEGSVDTIVDYGNGHIHDSFRVTNTSESHPDYLLQKINTKVFQDVPSVMHNILAITSHILSRSTSDDTLEVVQTINNEAFLNINEEYWRIYKFKKGFCSFDNPTSSDQVYESAKAFGSFFHFLSDFDPLSLQVTIPNFHNLSVRLDHFDQAVERLTSLHSFDGYQEVLFVMAHRNDFMKTQKLFDSGSLPTRVTHNDTKFNNVMFKEDGSGACVVDLDTVMPGLVSFDFGDGVRTGAVTMGEDEKDLSLVDVDYEKFIAFKEGYFERARDHLTKDEIDSLPYSLPFMAFIMGLRFLTDHILDDVYYKVSYKGHNLVRAKCQLRLSEVLMRRQKEIAMELKN